jgi:hypothetical protein
VEGARLREGATAEDAAGKTAVEGGKRRKYKKVRWVWRGFVDARI